MSLNTTIATLAAAAASVNTNPASKTRQIKSVLLYNANSSTEVVELFFVPSNAGAVGTAAATNRIFKKGLAADETFELIFGFALFLNSTNDSLQAKSTSAGVVTCTISYQEQP